MTPLEKCARALAEALDHTYDGPVARYVDTYDVDLREAVRSVLMAIREPDEETIDAARLSFGLKQYERQQPHRHIITAAIDHILSQ